MSLKGAARRLLDPWAGLVLAALIVLAVVILLATPGPWRLVGGEDAPVNVNPAAPSDVAVFALAGPAADRCSSVAWVHVDADRGTVTVTLVPAETRCPVNGGGYAPVRRIVTDLDPQRAADALGAALGVEFAGWVAVGRPAITRLFAAAAGPGSAKEARAAFKAAMSAFSEHATDLVALIRQRDTLRRVLRGLPFGEFKANAVVNYVLGSDDVVAGLDLRGATELVEVIHRMDADDAAVGVAAAVVETCASARSWRLDLSRLESLRLSLALGLEAPSVSPRLTWSPRAPEALVVTPASPDAGAFAADLQAELEDIGALPVVVRLFTAGDDTAAKELAELVRRRRPLAVVLVPRGASADEPEATAVELEEMATLLGLAAQPCVIVGAAAAGDELADAVAATGLPVVEVDAAGASSVPSAPGWLFAGSEARRTAARLTAAAVSRTCWPAYLAPALAGTRLGFSYAARHGTDVALAGAAAAELQPWLAACGYQAHVVDDAGAGGAEGPSVVYRAGFRRAALTVAGDLAWDPETVVRDPSAAAAVTVVWPVY